MARNVMITPCGSGWEVYINNEYYDTVTDEEDRVKYEDENDLADYIVECVCTMEEARRIRGDKNMTTAERIRAETKIINIVSALAGLD